MNLNMGNQIFEDVRIPLLWGKRAILEDKTGRISIILLDGNKAVLEVLRNEPTSNIQYEPIEYEADAQKGCLLPEVNRILTYPKPIGVAGFILFIVSDSVT